MTTYIPTPMQVHFDEDFDDKGRRLAAVFVCSKEWADLAPTDRKDVRHCDNCKSSVYLIDDARGFTRAVAAKQCVAISPRRASVPGESRNFLGGPILIDYQPGGALNWDE